MLVYKCCYIPKYINLSLLRNNKKKRKIIECVYLTSRPSHQTSAYAADAPINV